MKGKCYCGAIVTIKTDVPGGRIANHTCWWLEFLRKKK